MLQTELLNGADSDLERRIASCLEERHLYSLRQIQIEAHDGVVTLRGTVTSFYERSICLSCCQRIAGVRRLVDKIEVAA